MSRSTIEFSGSKQNAFDEFNGDYESPSFQTKKASDIVADSAAQAEKISFEASAGTACQEILVDNVVQKENCSYIGAPSSKEYSVPPIPGGTYRSVNRSTCEPLAIRRYHPGYDEAMGEALKKENWVKNRENELWR
ncbi:hypothetical protein B296_00036416 [Ensete ventricosum]|uniref:Uncharacterized protein n=1 Tax=Ensete ventricosum TaxID=4639 RepID=A0A427A2T5_ENSVE|nr:hypothetical protein B296_00036416 [Ensete ventricosum]